MLAFDAERLLDQTIDESKPNSAAVKSLLQFLSKDDLEFNYARVGKVWLNLKSARLSFKSKYPWRLIFNEIWIWVFIRPQKDGSDGWPVEREETHCYVIDQFQIV